MPDVSFVIAPPVTAQAVNDLRAAVGWSGDEDDYPKAFAGYWATVAGFDAQDTLIAWCAILSDGVRHAVLLDVIVHPTWQRGGVGRALVARAVEYILAHDITIIHVDFLPEHAAFYERCGFEIGSGGIYNL